jgi:hypothetical protein
MQKMGEMIAEAENQPRFESGIVLALEDGQWRPFLPPESSEAYEILYRHRVASVWRDYDEQKRLLDELHEKRGIDVHVATYAAHEDRATQQLSTVAVWSERVEALLPRTDSVAFTSGDPQDPEMLGVAPWERVAEVAGELMEQTDHWPPRWRVTQFPTQEQLDAMELEEAPLE